MAISSKAIVKKIGNANLELVRAVGHGYWYFVYSDEANGVYETESVYVPRLNDMALERWVQDGKNFVAKVEEIVCDRAAFPVTTIFKISR